MLIGANPPIICSILSLLQKAFHSSSLLAPIALSKTAPATSSPVSPISPLTPACARCLFAVPPAFTNAPIAPFVDSFPQLFGTIFFNILPPAPANAPPRRSVWVSFIELTQACKPLISGGSMLYSPSFSPCITVPDIFSIYPLYVLGIATDCTAPPAITSTAPLPANLAPRNTVPTAPFAPILDTTFGNSFFIVLPIAFDTTFVAPVPIPPVSKNCPIISTISPVISPDRYQPLTSPARKPATAVFIARASNRLVSSSVNASPLVYRLHISYTLPVLAKVLIPKLKKLFISALSLNPAHILPAQLLPFVGASSNSLVSSNISNV